MDQNITESNPLFKAENPRQVAGFWTRFFALIIDSVILGIFGYLLSSIFGNFFASLQSMGRLYIGLPVCVLYFGLMNSNLFSGQTIGKKILGMKVINKNGRYLTLSKSLTRSLVFIFPIMLNGTHFPYKFMENMTLLIIIMAIVITAMAGEIYLYLFNKGNRQSLHDVILGSLVVKSNSKDPASIPQIWKGHLVITGIIFLVASLSAFKLTLYLTNLAKKEEMQKLENVLVKINALPGLSNTTISKGSTTWQTSGENTKTTFVSVESFSRTKIPQDNPLRKEILDIVCRNFSEIKNYDIITFDLKYMISIGIYSTNHSYKDKVSTEFCSEKRI